MLSFTKLTRDPPKSWKDLIVSHVTITCVYRINKIKQVIFQDSKERLHHFKKWVRFCNYYSIFLYLCTLWQRSHVYFCHSLKLLYKQRQKKTRSTEQQMVVTCRHTVGEVGDAGYLFRIKGFQCFVNFKYRIETHPKVFFLVFVD